MVGNQTLFVLQKHLSGPQHAPFLHLTVRSYTHTSQLLPFVQEKTETDQEMYLVT